MKRVSIWSICLFAAILVFVFSCAGGPRGAERAGGAVMPDGSKWFFWMLVAEPDTYVLRQSNLPVSRGGRYEAAVWAKGAGPMVLSVYGEDGRLIASQQYELSREYWSLYTLPFRSRAAENVTFAIGSGDLDFNFFRLISTYFGKGGGIDTSANLLLNHDFSSGPVKDNFVWEILATLPASQEIKTPEDVLRQNTRTRVIRAPLTTGRWHALVEYMAPNRPIIDQVQINLAVDPADMPYEGNWYLRSISINRFSPLVSGFINIDTRARQDYTFSVMAKGNGRMRMSVMSIIDGRTASPVNSPYFHLTDTWTEYTFAVPRRLTDNYSHLKIQIHQIGSTDFRLDNVFFGHGTVNFAPNPGFELGYEGLTMVKDINNGEAWWIQNRGRDVFHLNQSIDVLANVGNIFEASFWARGEGNLVFGAVGASGERTEKTITLTPYWYKHMHEIDTTNFGPTASFFINAGSEGVMDLGLNNVFFGSPGLNRLANPGFEDGPDGNFTVTADGSVLNPGMWRILSGLTAADIIRSTGRDPNLLQNPGFEQGTRGWRVTGAYDIRENRALASVGSRFIAIENNTASAPVVFFDQLVTVRPGEMYQASIWARGTGEFTLRVSGGDRGAVDYIERNFQLTNTWQRYYVPVLFNSSNTYEVMTFSVGRSDRAGTFNYFFDNASFVRRVYGPAPPEDYFVPAGHNWTLEWYDNFEGDELCSDRWVFWNGWGSYRRRDAVLSRDEAWVEDGNLVIRSRMYNGQPQTAMIATFNDARPAVFNKRFGPGRFFEASVSFRDFVAQGQWFAFWLMDAPASGSSYDGDPSSGGEIDILEYIKWHRGHEEPLGMGASRHIHPAYHMGFSFNGRWSDDPHNLGFFGFFDPYTEFGYDMTDGQFHRFGAAWYSDRIVWYINGRPYFEVANEFITQSNSLGLILSIEIHSTGWGRGLTAYYFAEEFFKPYNDGRENFVYIDYVRVFKLTDGEVPSLEP